MRWFYTLGIYLYGFAIRLAALFNVKAKQWVVGRKNWRQQLSQSFAEKRDLSLPLWHVHCASLGEFEQGRPLIEGLKTTFDCQILLTFFSPSGYEIRKDYPHADFIAYLPLDTPAAARDFVKLVQPTASIFVKYEFWYHHLRALQQSSTALYLVSAIFHDKQPFGKWYGSLHREMLGWFRRIFLQDAASAKILDQLPLKAKVPYIINGDTRVDRVLQSAKYSKPIPVIADFLQGQPAIIFGSNWEADEAVFLPVLTTDFLKKYKFIFAPHDVSKRNISRLTKTLPFDYQLFTKVEQQKLATSRILVLDTIGVLMDAYQYGEFAYIGGGFGAGIHSILEPLAHGLPVVFGPRYHKFAEATYLVNNGGAWSINSTEEASAIFTKLSHSKFRNEATKIGNDYLQHSAGATETILGFLKSYHLKID